MLCRTVSLTLLGLFCSLVACAQPPAPVRAAAPLDFETDPRVLQGIWTGEDERGRRLLIDANASAPKDSGYTITGTFQLDDAEPVVIEGSVSATVTPTSRSPASFTAASFEGGWRLEGNAPAGSPPRFEVVLSRSDKRYTFTMTTPAPTALEGSEWTLTTLLGKSLVEGSNVTLNFGNYNYDGFSGYSGCNYYGARYLATDTMFSVVYGVLSTQMLCETPTGVMAQEEAYGLALGDVTTYRVIGNRLEVVDEEGHPVLVFKDREQPPMDPVALVGTRWLLRSVGGEDLTSDMNITLAFPRAGELSGSAGCVAYRGMYVAEGNDIRVTMLGADYEKCDSDERLSGQEAAYSDYLSTTTDYQLSAANLQLFTAPGATLVFEAQP